ncbi:MAG TPA: ABC transporter permease [Candidatus Acidoferrales bacterium]|nr:ABC transporter permease [Candidatus Acidoferrales bacterium]
MRRRKRMIEDLDAEIREHIERETEDNIDRGMSPHDARIAARRKFGNVGRVQEDTRDVWSIPWLEQILQDARYTLRALRRSPGFTIAAVLTLAIGIGANAAVFSVVNSVLLEPLRYPNPDQLVALRQAAPGAAGLANFSEGLPLSPSMYFTFAEHNGSFQAMGVWFPGTASVTGLAEPEQVRTVSVSDGVLETFDVPPLAGRWLSAADQDPHGSRRVMLSYGYWQQRFGGSLSAVGRNIVVDSQPREIVGVMPRGFRIVNEEPELILPLAFDRAKLILAGFGFQGVARLKPGVSVSQADADLSRMLPIWMDSWSNGPGTNPHFYDTWRITPQIRHLKDEVVGNVADILWVVMATVGIVMLIACANVANLLLVKGESRQQELAIRAVLGAPKGRIVRGLLVESVILGLLGGALGLALAGAGLRLLIAIGPANLPRLSDISFGGRALAFTLALSLISAVLFGLISALKHARPGGAVALRSESRTASASRERHRVRNALVVAQVAMALVLLVSAGLMIRTFVALRNVDPGFTSPAQLQLARISIPTQMVKEPVRVLRMQNEIADRIRAIPGVESVGFGSEMPMEGFEPNWDTIAIEGRNARGDANPPLYLYEYVSPGFFRTAGTRLIAGRDLTWTDVYGLRQVGLVSENLARDVWGSPSNAIGKRFREFSSEPWREVVGVVQDVREDGVNKKAPQIVYWPSMAANLYGPGAVDAVRTVTFAVRTERAGTEGFLKQLQRTVWSVNADLPLASVRTMQDVYDESLAQTSFSLIMLGIAAAMALTLGIIGIYGVVSYVLGQRLHEIGIRVALGAGPRDILQLVLGHSGRLAAAGIILGLVASLGLTRLMATMLFGVSATDPLTLLSVSLVLIGVSLLAGYVPARKAMRVDPMVALRHE